MHPADDGPSAPTGTGPAERADRRGHAMLRRSTRRVVVALLLVATIEVVGTVGIHAIEGAGWVDAFYFESMLATGQGPPFPLTTDSGKVFASIMGFVSLSSFLLAAVSTLGPFVARLWREATVHAEAELRRMEAAAHREMHHFEEDLEGTRPR